MVGYTYGDATVTERAPGRGRTMSLSDITDLDDLKMCVACRGYLRLAEFHPKHTDLCKRCGDLRDERIKEEKRKSHYPPSEESN
jgi:hypothetical protein